MAGVGEGGEIATGDATQFRVELGSVAASELRRLHVFVSCDERVPQTPAQQASSRAMAESAGTRSPAPNMRMPGSPDNSAASCDLIGGWGQRGRGLYLV